MAQGLLGGVLPAIYSGADQLKRNIYGLLTNPREMAERAGQSLLQSRAERQALMAQAFADPNNPLKVTNPQALNDFRLALSASDSPFLAGEPETPCCPNLMVFTVSPSLATTT